jgi:hypothetical protein
MSNACAPLSKRVNEAKEQPEEFDHHGTLAAGSAPLSNHQPAISRAAVTRISDLVCPRTAGLGPRAELVQDDDRENGATRGAAPFLSLTRF